MNDDPPQEPTSDWGQTPAGASNRGLTDPDAPILPHLWPIGMVNRDSPPPSDMMDIDLSDENSYRRIKYDFSEDVLRLPRISTM